MSAARGAPAHGRGVRPRLRRLSERAHILSGADDRPGDRDASPACPVVPASRVPRPSPPCVSVRRSVCCPGPFSVFPRLYHCERHLRRPLCASEPAGPSADRCPKARSSCAADEPLPTAAAIGSPATSLCPKHQPASSDVMYLSGRRAKCISVLSAAQEAPLTFIRAWRAYRLEQVSPGAGNL